MREKVTRRDFLKWLGIGVGAAVVSAGTFDIPERHFTGSKDDIDCIKAGLAETIGECRVYTPTPSSDGLQRLCVAWCDETARAMKIQWDPNDPLMLAEIVERFKARLPEARETVDGPLGRLGCQI